MHNKFIPSIVIIAIACLSATCFIGCNRSDSATSVGTDPTITRMRFTANDSFPGLAKASFTIINKYLGDTGRIYSADSLQYGTKLDKVIPIFSYNSTPYSLQLHIANDTLDTFIMFRTGDTINFNLRPMYLTSTAQNMTNKKTYCIDVDVHQADPDLFKWIQTTEQAFQHTVTQQKVIYVNQTFFWLTYDGTTNRAYSSSDTKLWQPFDIDPDIDITHYITSADTAFYFTDTTISYSTDMTTWNDYTTLQLGDGNILYKPLFGFDQNLWAIIYNSTENKYVLGSFSKNQQTIYEDVITDNFPIEGFAPLTFTSSTGRERAMLIGGYSTKGGLLNTIWNFEHSNDHQLRIINYSEDINNNYTPLAGTAATWYNNDIYIFGGLTLSNALASNQMMYSQDDGMHWAVPDTAHNRLPESFGSRYNVAIVNCLDGNIYLFGGKSHSKTYSDVFHGSLNSLIWKLNR